MLPSSRAYSRAYRKLTLSSPGNYGQLKGQFNVGDGQSWSFRRRSEVGHTQGLFFGARRAVAYPSGPMIRPNICTQAPMRSPVWQQLNTFRRKSTPLHAIDSIITLALLYDACHVCKLPLFLRLHWMPPISMTSHHLSRSNRSLGSFARFDAPRPPVHPYHAHIEAQVPFWSRRWSPSGRYR